jgi:hypothetical protein
MDLNKPHRARYSRLSIKLIDLGFQSSKADTSLFFHRKGDVWIFVLIYVDDIIVASSTQQATTSLLEDLKVDFALKDLGELHYFLGIEVKKTRDGILLSQEKYTSDILKRFGMLNCKQVSTPMSTSGKLLIHDGTVMGPQDATRYPSIVGALQYLTLTRPNIFFPVKIRYANFYTNLLPFIGWL